MRRARAAPFGVLLALLVAVSACTDDTPAPAEPPASVAPAEPPAAPIGVRVGIVLPPTSVLDPTVLTAIEAQMDQLAATTDETVRELRALRSTDPRFVEDVARWLSEQGTELVCVLGDRAEDVAVALASLYRGLRFCALPTGPPPPDAAGETSGPDDDVVRVELRVEELGFLVGVAARAQADGAPVGLVLGGDELPDERFREGLLAGLAGAEVVEADVRNGQEATLADRAAAVLAADATVVVLDGGIGAADAIEIVGDGASVLAPDAVLGSAPGAEVALSWSVRWDRALAGPLAALARGPDTPVHTSVGLREDAFEVRLGGSASGTVGPALESATEGVVTGRLGASAAPSPPVSGGPGADGGVDPPDEPAS